MERTTKRVRHLLQTYKDSLVILKEIEDGLSGRISADDPVQVSRIMGTAVGKLIADVEVVIASCVDLQCRIPLGGDAKGKRKVSSNDLVRTDVKTKRRAVSTGGIRYQHGEHSEVMDPSLWGNLPVPLLEIVFDRVMLKIHDSTQCRSLKLTDPQRPNQIRRLMYAKSGNVLLALGSNAVHKLWKWPANIRMPPGEATASVSPLLWEPQHGMRMANDTVDINPEEAVHCIALSKNDSYIVSASGGKVSLFNTWSFKVMTTCMSSSPAVTFLALFPGDNNIMAIGMEDSIIRIYNLRVDRVVADLYGHQERITSLAFSSACDVLVSAGADAQLCMWTAETWSRRRIRPVRVDSGGSSRFKGDIHIEFHCDEVRFLVVHESKLAIYEAIELGCLHEWACQSRCWAPISSAAYSCDGQLVFAGFADGSAAIFDAARLLPRCQLAPSVYIPQGVSGPIVYPLVIAAHPMKPNQFALGLSDGSVQVIEPLKSEKEWGTLTILPYLHS